MKLTPSIGTFGLVLGLLTAGFAAHAQNYSIPWYRVAGGGGTSSGGSYTVSGTVGQAEAGPTMTGGAYTLTGGFWSLISVIQTTGLPNLQISHTGQSVTISWTATGTYTLLQTPALTGSTWTPSGYPITTTNGVSSITIAAPTGNLFFRLSNP